MTRKGARSMQHIHVGLLVGRKLRLLHTKKLAKLVLRNMERHWIGYRFVCGIVVGGS